MGLSACPPRHYPPPGGGSAQAKNEGPRDPPKIPTNQAPMNKNTPKHSICACMTPFSRVFARFWSKYAPKWHFFNFFVTKNPKNFSPAPSAPIQIFGVCHPGRHYPPGSVFGGSQCPGTHLDPPPGRGVGQALKNSLVPGVPKWVKDA